MPVRLTALPHQNPSDFSIKTLHAQTQSCRKVFEQSKFICGQTLRVQFTTDFAIIRQRHDTANSGEKFFQLGYGKKIRRSSAYIDACQWSRKSVFTQPFQQRIQILMPPVQRTLRFRIKRAISAFGNTKRYVYIQILPVGKNPV